MKLFLILFAVLSIGLSYTQINPETGAQLDEIVRIINESESVGQKQDILRVYGAYCANLIKMQDFSLAHPCLAMIESLNRHFGLALDEVKEDLAKINASMASGRGQ